jgi:hypothetical protein
MAIYLFFFCRFDIINGVFTLTRSRVTFLILAATPNRVRAAFLKIRKFETFFFNPPFDTMRTSWRLVAVFTVIFSLLAPFVSAYSWDSEDVEVDNSLLLRLIVDFQCST